MSDRVSEPFTKQCIKCEKVKGYDEFPVSVGYRRNTCKECYNRYRRQRSYRYENGIPFDIRALLIDLICSGKTQARKKGHYPCTTPIHIIEKAFTTICAICSIDAKNKIRLDHCHKTGKFRGFLCNKCNTDLGALENKEFVCKANQYLTSRGR